MKKEGDIYIVNLNPTRGREQNGIRPCVVVSGKSLNTFSHLCMVCPLTTTIRDFDFHPVLSPNNFNGLKKNSQILTHQIKMVDEERFINKIGNVSGDELKIIRDGIVHFLYY